MELDRIDDINDILDANKAKEYQNKITSDDNRKLLLNIYNEKILPTIQNGKNETTYYHDKEIPIVILNLLREKHYSVRYGTTTDARHEVWEDKRRIIVSW